jgi:hypothetical protein
MIVLSAFLGFPPTPPLPSSCLLLLVVFFFLFFFCFSHLLLLLLRCALERVRMEDVRPLYPTARLPRGRSYALDGNRHKKKK